MTGSAGSACGSDTAIETSYLTPATWHGTPVADIMGAQPPLLYLGREISRERHCRFPHDAVQRERRA